MSTPFVAQSILTYPPDDGEAAVDRSNTVNSSYDELAVAKLLLTGASTHSVDFGTIATEGAKAIQIEADSANTAAVMVQLNGGGAGGQWEISAGGHIGFSSPAPTALGVLSMDIVHTVDSTVWVRILG